MNVKNLSVKKKLIFLQLLVVFAVLVLHSLFHFLNSARIFRDTISTNLESMANILGYNCTSALNFRDDQDAARTLASLAAEADVTHAWILDASGRVFAAYTRPGRKSEPPPVLEGGREATLGRTLFLARRILQDQEAIGTVLLGYDLGSFRKMRLRSYGVAGLALFGGMAVALLLALLSHRALSAPILRLAGIIGRVSRTGDLSIRIDEPRKDEIGVLYRGFNDMLAEVRKLNETLERRVEERTRELAAANERLIELDRLKSLFLASMSHELRTPLNSILGFTGLLLMGMSGNVTEEQARQLTMVQSSATHLLDLINEILDISKIESGRVEIAIESFPIAAVAEETVKAVAPLAAKKGLAVTADLPEGLILQSDRRRVKQVLMNLLSNAIKFSDQGLVRVEGKAIDGALEVRVSDQGIGIRPEDVERLFNPFSQIDMSSTKHYEGTGLGLYLCRKIMSLLRGAITVASEYGRGSTFTFVLPLKWKEVPDEKSARH